MAVPESAPDDLPRHVFDGTGAAVVRQLVDLPTTLKLQEWTMRQLGGDQDANARHPKQLAKRLVNDVCGRLGRDDPALLARLVGRLGDVGDPLLGLAKVGSLTMHVTEGLREGDAPPPPQTAHVDYPLHVRSGRLWAELEAQGLGVPALATPRQLETVYPYLTVQVLVALQPVHAANGATQLVPGSQRWAGVDGRVLDKGFRGVLDAAGAWATVELSPGDALVFSRRVVHRAGVNTTPDPRAVCIAQLAMPFAVPQQLPPPREVTDAVVGAAGLDATSAARLRLRLEFPYPLDTRASN